MASCNVDSLLADGKCFASCASPGLYYPLKLALLCQIWQSLSPGADCSVNALLANAACFNCIPAQMIAPLRLQLLCQIAGGGGGNVPNTPTNLDVSNSSTNANTILTWSQVTAPDKNLIERSIDGGAYAQVAIVSGNLTTYTDTATVGDGSLWRYRVKAMNGVQTSNPTNTVAVASNYNHNNDNLTSISIPDLIICYGDLITINETLLTTLSLPALRKVLGIFASHNCVVCTTYSSPALISVGSTYQMGNAGVTSLSLPVLASVIVFDVGGSGLTSLSLPSLTSCTADFAFNTCPALASVTVNSLTAIGGQIIGSNSTSLVTISMTALASLVGQGPGGVLIDVSSDTALTTVSMPNVVYNDGQLLTFSGCNLSAASVNQVLARGVASPGVATCDFELAGGTNAAPTGQGITDRTTLRTRGNTVNTN